MQRNIIQLLLIVCLTPLSGQADETASKECNEKLLISNWKNNNVKVFDGCSRNYLRDLDTQGLISGPLGILEAPDGDILVISETNNRLVKFDRGSLSKGSVVMGDDPATEAIEDNFIDKPSGAIIAQDGAMYVSSYGTNEIVKVNTKTWTIEDTILAAGNEHIKGIDAGMKLTLDGHLLVPGYDSDNILRINVATKQVEEFVKGSESGLDAPRTILIREDQNEFLVTGERSNNIQAYNLSTGEFLRTVVEIARPTGLIADDDDHFIANHMNAVFRVSYDGKSGDKIIPNGAGELDSATFIYRLSQ